MFCHILRVFPVQHSVWWVANAAHLKCASDSGELHSCWLLLPSPAQFYCCSHYLLLTLPPVHPHWQIEELQDIIVSMVAPLMMSKLAQFPWLLSMFPAILTNHLADLWTLQNTQVVDSTLLKHCSAVWFAQCQPNKQNRTKQSEHLYDFHLGFLCYKIVKEFNQLFFCSI